jgi:hypothetical protein
MRKPSLSSRDRAAFLSELSLCIAEAEVSSAAQAATVTILARTGYDATEAFASLLGEMDALMALRSVRTCLSAPSGGTPAP